MLVMSRTEVPGRRVIEIQKGNDVITVAILSVGKDKVVRVGIDAPAEYNIAREELIKKASGNPSASIHQLHDKTE